MIKNTSRKKIVSEISCICRSSFSKAIGLMFRFKPKTLVFEMKKESIVPLHMMFVFFPIDVLFVGKDMKIKEIKENFRQFTFYTSSKKAKYVIELPAGSVRKSGTKTGDIIRIFQETR